MNLPVREPKLSPERLLPHQVAFVDGFFESDSKRITALRWAVGLGKGSAIIALVSRLLRERPTARVLVVIPAGLRAQYVERLLEAGAQTLSVDRYRFRELLDSASGKDIWPRGMTAVVTREFARQYDVLSTLASTHWDLAIVEEAHHFRGNLGRQVVRCLVESSERLVVTTMPNLALPDEIPASETTVLELRRDQVVDFDGKPFEVLPSPVLRAVVYGLSPAEQELAETVGALCQALAAGTTQQALVARVWRRSFQSSPASLEARLPSMEAIRRQAGYTLMPQEVPEDEDTLEDEPVGWIDLETAKSLAPLVERLAQQIESLGSDSKLAAFIRLLKDLTAGSNGATRICILTEFRATLFYLNAEIESLGFHPLAVHGDLSFEDRWSALRRFSSHGDILIATRVVVWEGVDLNEVTDLVLYDVPEGNEALQQILGRFDRLGRRSQLKVHAMVPTSDAAGFTDDGLNVLKDVEQR